MSSQRLVGRPRIIATIVFVAMFSAILPLAAPQTARAADTGAFTAQGPVDDFWSSAVARTPANSTLTFADGEFTAFGNWDIWQATVKPPTGQQFVAGQAYSVTGTPDTDSAQLTLSGGGVSCSEPAGTLDVLAATYSGDELASFAADYELHCYPGGGPTYGSFRWNSAVDFDALVAPKTGLVLPMAYLGSRTPGSIEFENMGTTTLALGTVAFSNLKQFELVADTCSGSTLAPGGSCEVTMMRSESSAGDRATGRLTVPVPELRSGAVNATVQGERANREAPPLNDSTDTPTQIAIGDLPYANTQGSGGATSSTAYDPAPLCGASPAKSVWYSLTTGSDSLTVQARAQMVDDPGAPAPSISVYQDSSAGRQAFGCGHEDLQLTANSTYAIMVSGDVGSGDWVFAMDAIPDFVGVNPYRLLDTRTGIGGAPGPIEGGSVRALTISGVPGIPSDARAVSLNVTVTGGTAPGYVTVFPCGSPRPTASNLNYATGQTIPNAVIARAGSNGQACFYVSGTTHLVVDANGYLTDNAKYSGFAPKRAADTRGGVGPSSGTVPAGGTLAVQLAPFYAVPSSASAVTLNVTVTQPAAGGFVTVYPCGEARPTASNLNFSSGQTIANAVLSAVGQDGRVCLYSSARTHLVVDVSGWFGFNSNFEAFSPERILDSRNGGTALRPGQVIELPVAKPGELTAVSMNVTVTQPQNAGFVTIFPCGQPRPNASNLNFVQGETIPNAVIAPVGASGSVCLYTSAATHVVVDLNGRFPAA